MIVPSESVKARGTNVVYQVVYSYLRARCAVYVLVVSERTRFTNAKTTRRCWLAVPTIALAQGHLFFF